MYELCKLLVKLCNAYPLEDVVLCSSHKLNRNEKLKEYRFDIRGIVFNVGGLGTVVANKPIG